jgi:hypothetical protein
MRIYQTRVDNGAQPEVGEWNSEGDWDEESSRGTFLGLEMLCIFKNCATKPSGI